MTDYSRVSVAHRCKTCGVGVDKCMEFRAGRRPHGQDSFCCPPCRVIGSHYDEDAMPASGDPGVSR